MKISVVKITKSSSSVSWYVRRIGELFYVEESRPYDDAEYLVLREYDDPAYIGDCYIRREDCEVIEEFDGRVIPTNTIEIRRLDHEDQ